MNALPHEGPLRGVRVLDATTMLAGPYAGALLADFGADVIKVEDVPAGDPMRRTPPIVHGQHIPSKSTNRNKRSVCIDLRRPAGQDLFRRLAATVDVVMVNFRPSTLRAWQLDYDDLAADHPELVMFHLTAFGRQGAEADRPGFASIAEAFAGLTHISGPSDGPPMFAGFPVADGVGGVHSAFAVMLALFERQRTGRGQLVDLALYEPVLRMLDGMITAFDVTREPPERVGNDNRDIVPNGIYQTSEGAWIVLPVSSPNMWRRFCDAMDRPDLATDARFATNVDRVHHRAALDDILTPLIRSWTAPALLDRLRAFSVAAGPVNTIPDVCASNHAWNEGSIISVFDPHLGAGIAMPGVVPRLSVTPGQVRTVGPEPGEHTSEVLAAVTTPDEIRRLREDGVVSGPLLDSSTSAADRAATR